MSAAAARRAPAPRPWTHYVNDRFFDRPDLEPNLERLAFRLERLARDRPWCLTSNDELCEQLRCSQNTLAATLNRGESLGWFRRVLVPGRGGRVTARLGFVLFVRPTDRPVATPQTFDQVADQMRAAIRRGSTRSRTLPFPAPAPQELGTMVPKNWAPTVPKNWAPSPSSKEETIQETTTTATDAAGLPPSTQAPDGSSSSLVSESEPEGYGLPGVEALGDVTAPRTPAAGASNLASVSSPAPLRMPVPTAPPIAAELPAELVTAAAESVPGASREWTAGLLRDCGAYGLDLALLVVAWVKARRPQKPTRYARVALSSWLTRLRSGAMTLDDVRAEVKGGTGPPGSRRAFDPAVCLARMACEGWALVPVGADRVMWTELSGRSASPWKHIAGDLRQQLEEYKAELKAYVLTRAAERGKAVGLRA